MTNILRDPFIVRRIRGRLTAPMLERWPAAAPFTFELREPSGEWKLVQVGSDGTFDAGPLEPGTYCFRVSAEGFQAYVGSIVVDRRADEQRTIEVAVHEGV